MRNIPEQKAFQSLMWEEMSRDPEWSDTMDRGVSMLLPGKPWPVEQEF